MSRFTAKRRRGFTLIEIMIVVLIIGILLAIAIPNFMRARETSRAKSCCANLRQIQTAKEQWAMDFKQASDATPTDVQLTTDNAAATSGQYMKEFPTCPSGGGVTYAIGDMNTLPSCTNGSGDVGTYNYHGLATTAP